MCLCGRGSGKNGIQSLGHEEAPCPLKTEVEENQVGTGEVSRVTGGARIGSPFGFSSLVAEEGRATHQE